MAGACARFKQNAWKKELCSNCYRLKSGHKEAPRAVKRPPPLMSPVLPPPSQGILSLNKKKKEKKKSVRFREGESDLIGYGGDECCWSSEDEEGDEDYGWNSFAPSDKGDDTCEGEDNLLTITKLNTDFNSETGNLTEEHLQQADNQNRKGQVAETSFKISEERNSEVTLKLEELSVEVKEEQKRCEAKGTPLDKLKEEKKMCEAMKSPEVLDNLKGKHTGSEARGSAKATDKLKEEQNCCDLKNSPEASEKPKEDQKRCEVRGSPEGRKTSITRGGILTKDHAQVKNKLYNQSRRNTLNEHDIYCRNPVGEHSRSNKGISQSINRRTTICGQEIYMKVTVDEQEISKGSKVDEQDISTRITVGGQDVNSSTITCEQDTCTRVKVSGQEIIRRTVVAKEDIVRTRACEEIIGSGATDSDQDLNRITKTIDQDISRRGTIGEQNISGAAGEIEQERATKGEQNTTRSNIVGQHESNKIHINTGFSKNNTSNEVIVQVMKLVGDGLAESREMAGEPDGKADSDEAESQQSLVSPPPRSSFLHREAQVSLISPLSVVEAESPMKEEILRVVKPVSPVFLRIPPALPSTPPPLPSTPPPLPSTPPPLSCSLPTPSSPHARWKRRAPKPPDCEVSGVTIDRRRYSVGEAGTDKRKTRVKETLRKFLRLGSRDETQTTDNIEGPPCRPPRPHIIHPLDLNSSPVQVLLPLGETESAEIYSSSASLSNYSVGRAHKPPPPPRSESLNLIERLRPAPNSDNNVYANLGEGRCGLAPVKPQRSGSLREQQVQEDRELVTSLQGKRISEVEQNLYECVGFGLAPECDSTFPTYYGSETESDIYSPYVTIQNGSIKKKSKRVERRRIAYSTAEENYTAVFETNHDTLKHLLHQIDYNKPKPPKDLEDIELKWNMFDIDNEESVEIGMFTFVNAKLKSRAVTLSISSGCQLPDELAALILAEFSLTNPSSLSSKFFPNQQNVTISVMGKTKIERLSSFAKKIQNGIESAREGVEILLQVNKYLFNKSNGKVNSDNFIVFKSDKENLACTAYLQSQKRTEETVTVEKCMQEMCRLLIAEVVPLCRVIKGCNLTESEQLLETWLWGPPLPSAPLSLPYLASWLHLQRANFINLLLCQLANQSLVLSSSVNRQQLAFLVTATPKSIARSSEFIRHYPST